MAFITFFLIWVCQKCIVFNHCWTCMWFSTYRKPSEWIIYVSWGLTMLTNTVIVSHCYCLIYWHHHGRLLYVDYHSHKCCLLTLLPTYTWMWHSSLLICWDLWQDYVYNIICFLKCIATSLALNTGTHMCRPYHLDITLIHRPNKFNTEDISDEFLYWCSAACVGCL
jgi:hypothetical protein